MAASSDEHPSASADEVDGAPALKLPAFVPKTIIEPFRIKMVEALPILTREDREAALRDAHFNLFKVRSDQITIDLMTDSGTCAMSQNQWSAMMRGDESYAQARSWYSFKESVQEVTGFEHLFPTHQGRASERLLFSVMVEQGDVVPGNTHFDTTHANIEFRSGLPMNFPCPESYDIRSEYPFKGNIDIEKLREFLGSTERRVPLIILTVTNNTGGGQPVSMENMRALRRLADEFRVPLFVDCARFAENAWFVKEREEGQGGKTCRQIAREMFRLFDGALMSMKKDAFGNIGGFLALSHRLGAVAEKVQNIEILTEGFPTYGGLAGRDLEALAVGIQEILDERYLTYRMSSARYLFEKLDREHVPMLRPWGGHAIYLDARAFLPHIPPAELPGQALSVALYREGGVRSCEIGTVMFGHTDEASGLQVGSTGKDLVRLAFPRRVYTQSHFDYLAEVIAHLFKHREILIPRGLRIVREPPLLRHFTCDFGPLEACT